MKRVRTQAGFTIVELLIVIVVIGILAAITIVAFNGVQNRAKDAKVQAQVRDLERKLEAYNAVNGSYPATQTATLAIGGPAPRMVYIDANCPISASASVTKSAAWIPGLEGTLPQSEGYKGSRGNDSCYMYQSDGTSYLLSAWNMAQAGPQTSNMYRRIGFRETTIGDQYYHCNHSAIGAASPGPYDATRDYYKHSFTVSNLTSCNETPPTGA